MIGARSSTSKHSEPKRTATEIRDANRRFKLSDARRLRFNGNADDSYHEKWRSISLLHGIPADIRTMDAGAE